MNYNIISYLQFYLEFWESEGALITENRLNSRILLVVLWIIETKIDNPSHTGKVKKKISIKTITQ